jgi:hypothetical protein
MFNSINKYFIRLSPNQIELRELLDRQAIRIIVPLELEVEEDLGPIAENFTGNVNEYIEPEFEIEVMSDLEAVSDDEAVEDSSSDEEDEAEEEEEAVVQNVRQRKPSTMNGSIKKGKYSR